LDDEVRVYAKDTGFNQHTMKTAASWFQRSAHQGVFMKAAMFRTVNRSGPVQAHNRRKKVKGLRDRHIVVGKTIIGGDEIVGGVE